MSNRFNGTLYTGVTSALVIRVHQHRTGAIPGFTRTYGLHRLVYFERHATMREAIRREKQIKKWNRAWKVELIQSVNPDWRDLWPLISGEICVRVLRWIPASAGMTTFRARHPRGSGDPPSVHARPPCRSRVRADQGNAERQEG
jgi:putative endonuclease